MGRTPRLQRRPRAAGDDRACDGGEGEEEEDADQEEEEEEDERLGEAHEEEEAFAGRADVEPQRVKPRISRLDEGYVPFGHIIASAVATAVNDYNNSKRWYLEGSVSVMWQSKMSTDLPCPRAAGKVALARVKCAPREVGGRALFGGGILEFHAVVPK